MFDRPDKDRIKEVGPNRACAEWLLRCGATLKWKGSDRFQTDYHALPPSNFRSFVIEEVEAVEAGIMYVGFEHFGKILPDIQSVVNCNGDLTDVFHFTANNVIMHGEPADDCFIPQLTCYGSFSKIICNFLNRLNLFTEFSNRSSFLAATALGRLFFDRILFSSIDTFQQHLKTHFLHSLSMPDRCG